MSYSYIKTVFPKFENTTVIDSTKIFNSPTTTVTPLKVIGMNTETSTNSEINGSHKDIFYLTQEDLPTSQKDNLHYYNIPDDKNMIIENFTSQPIKDNLHYYNIPVDKNMMNIENFTSQPARDNLHYYNIPVDKNMMNIENFTPPVTETPHVVESKSNCDKMNDHIKDCAVCKEMLYKNFNMENKPDFNQEIFELISYCIFAVFVLFLLDKISHRK